MYYSNRILLIMKYGCYYSVRSTAICHLPTALILCRVNFGRPHAIVAPKYDIVFKFLMTILQRSTRLKLQLAKRDLFANFSKSVQLLFTETKMTIVLVLRQLLNKRFDPRILSTFLYNEVASFENAMRTVIFFTTSNNNKQNILPRQSQQHTLVTNKTWTIFGLH